MDATGWVAGARTGEIGGEIKYYFPIKRYYLPLDETRRITEPIYPAYFISLQRLRSLRCFLYFHEEGANEKDGWGKGKGKACEGKEEAFLWHFLFRGNELSIKFRGTNISRSSHVR